MNWIPVTSLSFLLAGLWFLSKEVASTSFPLWDESAFVLVVFGSLALSVISMGWRKCNAALYSVFDFLVPRKKFKVKDVVDRLIVLSQAQRDFDFERWKSTELNSYLDSCKEVVRDGIVTSASRHKIFIKRAEVIEAEGLRKALQIRHLGHYPIILGLVGLLVCSFSVTWGYLHGQDHLSWQSSIKMGFLSVTYGVMLSYFWIYPVARNVYERNKDQAELNRLVAHAMNLIGDKVSPIQVSEELNIYLDQQDRVYEVAA